MLAVDSVGKTIRVFFSFSFSRLWFLFANFTSDKKRDEEFPDCFLRDQSLVAKRLMESLGLKEWQE